MAERSFTDEQRQAIKLRGGSILVGAAAGSGKTTVLSERIVRMLEDESLKLDASRILVLTFSNAAAAEMRQRIKKYLNGRLKKEPNALICPRINAAAYKQRLFSLLCGE